MNLRTPDEIINDLTAARAALLLATENSLAATLEREYRGASVDIWLDGYKTKYEPIMIKLKESFAAKNWSICILDSRTDRRDGDSTCFRVQRLK